MALEENRSVENGWVCDSSLDHKGRLPLRSSTGTWKASLFIIAMEFSERLSYFAIATNLITYLTKVMHEDITTAAKNVNNWIGVTTITPLLGAFFADAYIGRFPMILLSSIVYLMGLGIITMSHFIPSLKPCGFGNGSRCVSPTRLHELSFFVGIYLVSLGTGGHKPSLESFGADQFDDEDLRERKGKMSFFNWWNVALCGGLALGVTLFAYVEDNYGWGFGNLILTLTMITTIVVFYLGRPFYRYRMPQGSPLTPILQVLVAAVRKRKLPHPSSTDSLYEVPESGNPQHRLLYHTNKLRFLDKACIVEDNDMLEGKKPSPWKLTTVTRVEETKLIANMIPIWLTCLQFGVCISQVTTFFVKQSSTMNRMMGNKFEIPAASVTVLTAVGMLVCVICYEKIITPILRRITGNERGILILQRVGIGMIISILGMVVAAVVERQRLIVVEKEGKAMSVFWLAPQYLILGIGDGFTLVGLQEYFYDQVPDSMRSIGIAMYLSVLGVGSFLSSFLITIVDHVTVKTGRSWLGKDLSSSRLDKFYWLLAAMNGLNFGIYLLLANRYSYKNVQRNVTAT